MDTEKVPSVGEDSPKDDVENETLLQKSSRSRENRRSHFFSTLLVLGLLITLISGALFLTFTAP